MRIGELARSAGVSVQTIRFYERKGLVRKPPRSAAGYRQYQSADVEIVRTIRTAQHFGFTLREIRRILTLYALPDEQTGKARHARGAHACFQELAALAAEKLAALDEKIKTMVETRQDSRQRLRGARGCRLGRSGSGPRVREGVAPGVPGRPLQHHPDDRGR